jgi:Cft2 family RNA processing exonuclease
VIHDGQCLPVHLEPTDHLFCVHAHLDDLQRHLSLHRLTLLGHVDHTKAAFA